MKKFLDYLAIGIVGTLVLILVTLFLIIVYQEPLFLIFFGGLVFCAWCLVRVMELLLNYNKDYEDSDYWRDQ